MSELAVAADPIAEVIKDVPIAISPGKQSFGPYDVPDKAEAVRILMNRCTSLDAVTWQGKGTTTRVSASLSLDGGKSWQACGSIGDEGGVILDKFKKAELGQTFYVFSVDEGAGRQLQIDVEVSGGTLTSKIGVEFV